MSKNPKPTPRAVVKEFIAEVDELGKSFDRVLAALGASSSPKRRDIENVVAEQFATSIAIAWENFVHNILVTYVLRSHKKYLKALQKRILNSVNEKFGAQCGKSLVFAFGTPSAFTDIEPLLDPKGWNITVRSGDELASTANKLLKSSIARKFSLDAEDRLFIDLLVALRNYLAHKSAGARATLLGALRNLDSVGKNVDLRDHSVRLNRYLLQPCATGGIRMKVILSRIKQIADEFD
jgi:hypothetical protein